MFIFSIAMMFAGTYGVPRRHWDITFANAPFDLQFSPTVDVLMAFTAIGGLLAAVGGAIYIVVTVWSVFLGKPLEEGAAGNLVGTRGVPMGLAKPPTPLAAGVDADAVAAKDGARGTMVLVFVFLAAFITYYFVNWKLLSFLWQVG
jgi:cytochrome c oxidase subunit 1